MNLRITHRIDNLTSETQTVARHIFLSAWRRDPSNGWEEDTSYRIANSRHLIKTHFVPQYASGAAVSTSQAQSVRHHRSTKRMRQTPRNARHRHPAQSPSAMYLRITLRVATRPSETQPAACHIFLFSWRRETNNGQKADPSYRNVTHFAPTNILGADVSTLQAQRTGHHRPMNRMCQTP